MHRNVRCIFFFDESKPNQKKLFENALSAARTGRVLYILRDELTELPELSQDLSSVNRHHMKMISFLYAKSLDSLIESVSTLPDWQNIPSTIILEDLSGYCGKSLQNACGVVAMLCDAANSCSLTLKLPAKALISVNRGAVGEEFYTTLNELYGLPSE